MPDPFVKARRLGQEGQPLVVVDDFHPEPERLVVDAAARAFEPRGKFYPGIRAAAPGAHLQPRQAMLADILKGVFGYQTGAGLKECNYSLVTTPPGDLLPMQRLPHYDGTGVQTIALLHYLCGPETGGTSFYRHRATGFETITEDRFESYRDTLQAEVDAAGGEPLADYFRGDSAQFERIDQVEAKFNRAVLYRGVVLHSGDIPEGFGFNADVKAGRLTVNSFFVER